MRLLALFFIILMMFSVLEAATIRVPQDQPTIQAGIDAAVDGDTVLVGPGVYAEHINFLGKGIVLRSSSGVEATTITRLVEELSLVTFNTGEDSTASIERFTIEGALGSGAAGIRIYGASPRILGNTIANNFYNGIYCIVGSPCIEGNLFFSNPCHHVYLDNAGAKLANNTFAFGVTSCGSSEAAIYVYGGSAPVLIKNNIIAYSSGRGITYGSGIAPPVVQYNVLYENQSGNFAGFVPGTPNLLLDPSFCDTAVHDFRLSSMSPCVGAGENGVNIGAFGIGCALPAAELPKILSIGIGEYEDSLHLTTHTPLIAWQYSDPQNRPHTKSELEVGSDNEWTAAEMWQPQTINSDDTSIVYGGLTLVDGATYYVRIRVHNDTIWGNWKSAAFRINTPPSFPTPNLPANASIVNTGRPTVRVTNASDPESDLLRYDFQVFSDSLLTSIVTFASSINQGSGQTGWKTDSLRNENAWHWWRSRASDGYETGDWSLPWLFRVNAFNEAPLPFSLNLPSNGAVGQSTTPTLSWTPASDPDPSDSVSYTLAIAIDSGFVFQSLIPDIAETNYAVSSSLNINTLYWWKVKATDVAGATTWSSQTFKFRTRTLGDPDGNGAVSIADAVYLINYIFGGGPAPNPLESGDADCNGSVSIADAVYLINYIFAGGPPPCEP